ncbi:MAG: ABC transporter ATP-binding protein [Gemmatimonadaceae bacterium]
MTASAAPSPASGTPAIQIVDVHKFFGPVHANRGASLEVAPGEIHALVGENGAGKSTLMRILAGLYAPDGGTVRVDGRDVTGWSTAEAIDAGVGMVHQHFMLVPRLTVAENVMLGRELTRGPALDSARAVREVEELSRRTGLAVPADRAVAELSVGEAQRVEILKALYRGARVLVLDEPTAVLSPPEVDELWAVLRTLRDEGGTVVLITHKLDEVMAVSDRVTVMQHGRTVARMATRDTSPREIAKAMVGRDVSLALDVVGDRQGRGPRAEGDAALEVKDLTVIGRAARPVVDRVSFAVAPGEILGVAGVEGNGQTELVEAVAGLRRADGGRVLLGGRDVSALDVRQRGDLGLSHIPEDRHLRGLVLEYSVADNLILGQQHRYARTGFLGGMDRAKVAAHAAKQVRAYDIRPADPALQAGALSGGNQQKVVIAREMGRDFTVLLAAQPTRGVDVGAIEFIHDQLRAARAAGKGILLVSADLAEVLALSDRVAVMYGGRFVVTLPAAEATPETLGPYMTGAHA